MFPTRFSAIVQRLEEARWLVAALMPILAGGSAQAQGEAFGPQRVITTSADGARSVFAADLDGDGDQDVLSASFDDDKIAWYENMDGLGAFGPRRVISDSADGAQSVFAADLDGDGDRDVLSASNRDNKVAWYANTDGNGLFGPQQIISSSAEGAQSVFAADLDGDGDQDVLSSSAGDDKIAWYENVNGLGAFGPQQVITISVLSPRSVFAVDLDGDEDLDVVSASFRDDKIAWYENVDGMGTFGTQQVITSTADGAQSVFAADLDGDGDPDVLSASPFDNKLAWYKNTNGMGAFGAEQVIATSAFSPRSVFAADLDGDGDQDVLSASANDDKIAWYENTDGRGAFGAQQVITTSANGAWSVFAADLDGDGDPEVISASLFDGQLAWYENPFSIHSVVLSDVDGINNPDDEWTNDPVVTVTWLGFGLKHDFVDLDEDPSFSSPTTFAYARNQYSYEFDTSVNELKTVYMRLRGQDDPIMNSDTIGLDTVAPSAVAAPTGDGPVDFTESLVFYWMTADDPVPASGVRTYHLQVGTAPGLSDVFDGEVGDTLSATVNGQFGQTLYARVRAIDRAGNAADWSDWSDGVFLSDDIRPTLQSIVLSDVDGQNNPDTEWTNAQTVTVTLQGVTNDPDQVEFDEDPAFGSPDVLSYQGDQYKYTFDSDENGLKTVYARVGNLAGTAAASDMIGLDTTAPSSLTPPTTDGSVVFTESPTFYWMAADDPVPASGVRTYHLQVGTAPDLSDVLDGEVGDILSATVSGQFGQTLDARVRAIDQAGNTAEWSDWSDGVFLSDDIRPTLQSIVLSDADGQNNPDTEWTNAQTVTVTLQGVTNDPDQVELDEDPSFGSATVFDYQDDQYEYTFDSGENGLKTVHTRVGNLAGTAVASDTIGLDTVAPGAPGTPTDAGQVSLSPTVRFSWGAATDPEPAAGVGGYDLQVGTAPGSADVFDAHAGNVLSRNISGPPGETLYARTRAIDRAGNAGDWSASSDGIFLDRPPRVNSLSIDPPQPRTLDRIEALVTATDPDGDPIPYYRMEWRRAGATRATGPALSPELTRKDENWSLRVRAVDRFGAESETSQHDFTIGNTPPSPPVILIRPKPTEASNNLIVDVQVYSVDVDGDEVDYKLTWFKSADGGATWVHKQELDNNVTVDQLFTSEGELWRVRYTPFEIPENSKSPDGETFAASVAKRVEGIPGSDQVYVGANALPFILFEGIETSPTPTGVALDVTWQSGDPDGESTSSDLYWTDWLSSGLAPLALDQPSGQRQLTTVTEMPLDQTIYLYAVITDAKGAAVQVISNPLFVRNAAEARWTLYD